MADMSLLNQGPVGTSETALLPGGTREPPGGIVSADGTTIGGDGTAENPLHAIGATPGVEGRTFIGQIPVNQIGTEVLIPGNVLQTAGIGGMPSTSRPVQACNAASVVIGIALNGGGPTPFTPITVQEDGIVTLTTAQWRAVRDDGATPSAGDVMYVSQAHNGKLTVTAPTGGQTSTLVGTFLNPTDLRLIGGPPITH